MHSPCPYRTEVGGEVMCDQKWKMCEMGPFLKFAHMLYKLYVQLEH